MMLQNGWEPKKKLYTHKIKATEVKENENCIRIGALGIFMMIN